MIVDDDSKELVNELDEEMRYVKDEDDPEVEMDDEEVSEVAVVAVEVEFELESNVWDELPVVEVDITWQKISRLFWSSLSGR